MPIPPPPPEVIDWLIAIIKSFCPAPVPTEVFDRVKRWGIIDQLRVKRGLAQKFRDAGRKDEWDAQKSQIMDQVREAARDCTLDDIEFALND